jgi:hypothetical protein
VDGKTVPKEASLRTQQYDRYPCLTPNDRFDSGEDGLWLHHHASPTTIGRIVSDAVFTWRVVTDVVQRDREAAAILGPLEDTLL